MPETYTIPCHCTNCDHSGTKELPRGQEVPALFECPNCGCVKASKGSGVTVQPDPWHGYIPMIMPPLPYQEPVLPTVPYWAPNTLTPVPSEPIAKVWCSDGDVFAPVKVGELTMNGTSNF